MTECSTGHAGGSDLFADTVQRAIGYGAMRLTGDQVWGPPPDPAEALRLLRLAYDSGVRVIDTAWYYGPGITNPLIAKALYPYADDLLLVTKAGNSRGNDRSWVPALTPADLRAACERDLRELRISELPLVLLRWHPEPGDQQRFLEALGAMLELREEGKLRRLGVSNVTFVQLELARAHAPIAAVSNALSLNNRRDLPTLRRCGELGLVYFAYYPLLTGSVLRRPALQQTSRRLHITPAQLAIAWLCAQSPWLVPIPGTASIPHLKENVEAQRIRVPERVLAGLEARVPDDLVS